MGANSHARFTVGKIKSEGRMDSLSTIALGAEMMLLGTGLRHNGGVLFGRDGEIGGKIRHLLDLWSLFQRT